MLAVHSVLKEPSFSSSSPCAKVLLRCSQLMQTYTWLCASWKRKGSTLFLSGQTHQVPLKCGGHPAKRLSVSPTPRSNQVAESQNTRPLGSSSSKRSQWSSINWCSLIEKFKIKSWAKSDPSHQEDSSAGACHQAWQPEFNCQSPHDGRREPICTSCPLIYKQQGIRIYIILYTHTLKNF